MIYIKDEEPDYSVRERESFKKRLDWEEKKLREYGAKRWNELSQEEQDAATKEFERKPGN